MELGYQKIDKYDEQCVDELAEHYKEIIRLLGENPEREGLLKSPERIAKAMLFFFKAAEKAFSSIQEIKIRASWTSSLDAVS